MARRPVHLVVLAVALVATLLTGCVRQAVPDGVSLEPKPELGETATPLKKGDAKRVAVTDVKKRNGGKKKPVPKGEEAGGLVPKGTKPGGSEPADDGDGTKPRADDSGSGDDGTTRPPKSGGSGSDDASNDGDGSGGSGSGGNDTGGNDGGGTGDGGAGDGGNQPPPDDDPDDPPSPAPQPPPFRVLADVSDEAGDQGREGPSYADGRRLLVESNGQRIRVTMSMNAAIPTALKQGEVEGIGVDFFRGDSEESQYQLFADGGSDGWRAYLQTPEGYPQYPGDFRLGGRVLVFEVPWSAIGGRKAARVRSFIDWSEQRTPLNATGNDRLPNKDMFDIAP